MESTLQSCIGHMLEGRGRRSRRISNGAQNQEAQEQAHLQGARGESKGERGVEGRERSRRESCSHVAFWTTDLIKLSACASLCPRLAKEPSTPSGVILLSVLMADDVRDVSINDAESLLLLLLPPRNLFADVCLSLATKMSETNDPSDSHLSHEAISGTKPDMVYVEDSLRTMAGGGSSMTALAGGDLETDVGVRPVDDNLDKTGVRPSRLVWLLPSLEPHDLEREKCEREDIGAEGAAVVVGYMVGFVRGGSMDSQSRFCQLRNFITPSRSTFPNDSERLSRSISPFSDTELPTLFICPAWPSTVSLVPGSLS